MPSLFFNREKGGWVGGGRPPASATPRDALSKTRKHAHTQFTKV